MTIPRWRREPGTYVERLAEAERENSGIDLG